MKIAYELCIDRSVDMNNIETRINILNIKVKSLTVLVLLAIPTRILKYH